MNFVYIICVFVILVDSYLITAITRSNSSEMSIRVSKGVQDNVWIPLSSRGKMTTARHHNLTMYLSYANNPFGSSTRLQHKNELNNNYTTTILTKNNNKELSSDNVLQTPTLSRERFNNDEYFTPTNASEENQLDKGGGYDVTRDDNVKYKTTLSSTETTTQEPRSKRGVIHLYNMVSCATGCNPLIYKGYGCYCGFLGSGYPVDGIDRCCKKHDWCYDAANCPMFLEYFVPYFWKCFHNRPVCAVEHGEWGGYGSCAQRLCECDRSLSECLSRYPCPSSRAICRSSPWRLLQNTLMIF